MRNAASEDDALEVGRASPATTSSSAPSSATTPTGAGCSPPSAPPSAAFDPDRLDVSDERRAGLPRAAASARTAPLVDLSAREVHVLVDLHAGDARRTIWTNDLTHDYVHENSAYYT